jgi:hypothetical protein
MKRFINLKVKILIGRYYLVDIGAEGSMILKWMLANCVCEWEFNSTDSGNGQVAVFCEHADSLQFA